MSAIELEGLREVFFNVALASTCSKSSTHEIIIEYTYIVPILDAPLSVFFFLSLALCLMGWNRARSLSSLQLECSCNLSF